MRGLVTIFQNVLQITTYSENNSNQVLQNNFNLEHIIANDTAMLVNKTPRKKPNQAF